MKQAVMYGAGNIGRGFVGALMSRSGYQVTFVDVAEPVVASLQTKGGYPVRYVSGEGHEDVWTQNVTAVNGKDMTKWPVSLPNATLWQRRWAQEFCPLSCPIS